MAGPDNRYSIFIGWAKILLPLAALALLSTIFLFARQSDDADRIPLSEIAAIAREPRISNPTFAGVADDGSVVSIRADEIRPIADQPDSFGVSGVRLSLVAADGSAVELSAGTGTIDGAGRRATFTDLVRITSSTGFAVEATGVRTDLRAGTVETEGALAGQAPFGRLDAGKLVISADPDGSGTRLLFQDGVRLLYEPQS
jgi:lipopolysaccharide export system protein LptC